MQRLSSLELNSNNIVPFPARDRKETATDLLDINRLVTGGQNGFTAYHESDGYKIVDTQGKVVWELRRVA